MSPTAKRVAGSALATSAVYLYSDIEGAALFLAVLGLGALIVWVLPDSLNVAHQPTDRRTSLAVGRPTMDEGSSVKDVEHSRKALEILIDLHWKAIAQVLDVLSRGFAMYFVVVGATLALLATRSGTGGGETLAAMLVGVTALAAVGLIVASRVLAGGVRRLDRTLRE
jgi:hypothetical protein